MCPQAQDQRSFFRGDQPHNGQRMRGPDDSRSCSTSCSGTMVGVSVFELMLWLHRRQFAGAPPSTPRPGGCSILSLILRQGGLRCLNPSLAPFGTLFHSLDDRCTCVLKRAADIRLTFCSERKNRSDATRSHGRIFKSLAFHQVKNEFFILESRTISL